MKSDGRALIKVMSVPDHAGVAGTLLLAMGESDINIELLVESFDLDDCGNFSLVIDQKDLDLALDLFEKIKPAIDAKVVSYTPDVAVITVFGPHLRIDQGYQFPGHQHIHFKCVLRARRPVLGDSRSGPVGSL